MAADAIASFCKVFQGLVERPWMLASLGLAEREGFEPSVEFPLHTLSKRAPSTTRTSLRSGGLDSLTRGCDAGPNHCERQRTRRTWRTCRPSATVSNLGSAPWLSASIRAWHP